MMPTTRRAIGAVCPRQDRGTVSNLNSDFCSIEDRDFFIRGCIEIPIVGQADMFVWGVWSSLSKESFRRALELWVSDPAEDEPSRFGWLSNNIEGYPATLNLKTNVHFRKGRSRPRIVLEPTDHPLTIEQRNGITIERVQEIAAALQHRH